MFARELQELLVLALGNVPACAAPLFRKRPAVNRGRPTAEFVGKGVSAPELLNNARRNIHGANIAISAPNVKRFRSDGVAVLAI